MPQINDHSLGKKRADDAEEQGGIFFLEKVATRRLFVSDNY